MWHITGASNEDVIDSPPPGAQSTDTSSANHHTQEDLCQICAMKSRFNCKVYHEKNNSIWKLQYQKLKLDFLK